MSLFATCLQPKHTGRQARKQTVETFVVFSFCLVFSLVLNGLSLPVLASVTRRFLTGESKGEGGSDCSSSLSSLPTAPSLDTITTLPANSSSPSFSLAPVIFVLKHQATVFLQVRETLQLLQNNLTGREICYSCYILLYA
jgi:hypothetical protein